MKLFIFTDIHGNLSNLNKIKTQIKEKKPDLLLCAGDITIFEQDLNRVLLRLNGLGKPLLLIHGNHESGPVLRHACSKYENIIFLHKKLHFLRNFCFVGYGGGGFSFVEPEFTTFIKKQKDKLKGKKLVLLVHQPPFKTKLDEVHREHAGNKTFRDFVVTYRPELVVCGHLHENEGKKDVIKKTKIINPGPEGVFLNI